MEMRCENILLFKIGYRKQRNTVNYQIKPYKQGISQKFNINVNIKRAASSSDIEWTFLGNNTLYRIFLF